MDSGTAPTYGLERGALNGFVAGLYNFIYPSELHNIEIIF